MMHIHLGVPGCGEIGVVELVVGDGLGAKGFLEDVEQPLQSVEFDDNDPFLVVLPVQDNGDLVWAGVLGCLGKGRVEVQGLDSFDLDMKPGDVPCDIGGFGSALVLLSSPEVSTEGGVEDVSCFEFPFSPFSSGVDPWHYETPFLVSLIEH